MTKAKQTPTRNKNRRGSKPSRAPKAKPRAAATAARKRQPPARKEAPAVTEKAAMPVEGRPSPPRRERTARPPETQPGYEPDEGSFIDPSKVVTDLDVARTPRGEVAKSIAAQAKGAALVEWIKTRRAGGGAVFDLNPYDLWLEPGWNARNFTTDRRKGKIGALALSIANSGVRETLIAHIKGDKVVVHSGWNRLLACYHAIEELGAEIHGIPVRFGRAGENDGDRKFSQIVNNMHDPLLPLEMGIVCKNLVQLGWSIEDIAARCGRQTNNIRQLLNLHQLPPAILQLIDAGTVTMHFATAEYQKAGGDAERTLLALHAAIRNAREKGAARVMPKHAEDALPRQARKARHERVAVARSPAQAPPATTRRGDIKAIFDSIVRVDDDEVEGVAVLTMRFAGWELLRQIAAQQEAEAEALEAVGDEVAEPPDEQPAERVELTYVADEAAAGAAERVEDGAAVEEAAMTTG